MKKWIVMVMTVLLMLPAAGLSASALTADSAEVYITISDSLGRLVLVQEKTKVTDVDNDGKLTVNDALYAAHEAKYEGGAAAGYRSYESEYGLSLSTLWGDTSGNFGYYVNNASAWSLRDEVNQGDSIRAFIYTDAASWSDVYAFFDKDTVTAEAGGDIVLTLSAAGYDAQWNPMTVPVADAVITVDGRETAVKTDAQGQAVLRLSDGGRHIVSAVSQTQILVAPVCAVTVNAAPAVSSEPSAPAQPETVSPATGDRSNVLWYGVLLASSLLCLAGLARVKRKTNEK